ncbi:MAG: DUF167 domain-containing protein [Myxococcota bacterium]
MRRDHDRIRPDDPVRLPVKVVPGASRDDVAGWLGDALKVRVAAPAERGKANAAVERTIAAALGIPGRCVRVVGGATSPRKIVAIEDLSRLEVHRRLSKPGP